MIHRHPPSIPSCGIWLRWIHQAEAKPILEGHAHRIETRGWLSSHDVNQGAHGQQHALISMAPVSKCELTNRMRHTCCMSSTLWQACASPMHPSRKSGIFHVTDPPLQYFDVCQLRTMLCARSSRVSPMRSDRSPILVISLKDSTSVWRRTDSIDRVNMAWMMLPSS